MSGVPIFYINLDGRPDRRAFMERQFAELGLAAQRVTATPAGAVSKEHLEQHCSDDAVHYRTRSELACWYSHLQCWREIIATGAGWGLVLEDDAVLSPKLPAFLRAFFAAGHDRGCDLVQLETVARRTRVLPVIARVEPGIDLRPFRSTVCGAAGYLIRASTLPVLLSDPQLFERPVDHRLFCPFIPAIPGWRLLLTDPALCIQAERMEVSGVANGNIKKFDAWPTAPMPVMRERRRLLRQAGIANFIDHIRHIPKGLKSRMIPFDSPGLRPDATRRTRTLVAEIES